MEKDIKDYREKELKNYVIGNILLILIGTGILGNLITAIGKENIWDAIDALIGSGVISALIYIYVFLIDCIVPGDVKNWIIWPKAGLPGNRVFSEIMQNNKDKRFTTQVVQRKYAGVYEEISESDSAMRKRIENSAWYAAYQRNEKSAQVFVSNRDWLLCRDMFVMTVWIIIGYIFALCFMRKSSPCWMNVVFLVELAATWAAAKIKSKRFVYNVIAKDLYSGER